MIRKIFKCFCLIAILLNILTCTIGQHQHFQDFQQFNELYEYKDTSLPIKYVPEGDTEFQSFQLIQSIHFYGEKYEQIFINTDGILTFNSEIAEYINQPFPLEFPSISGLYANTDTTGTNSTTFISIFQSKDPDQLKKVNNLVQFSFIEKRNFEATQIIVCTWKNVGYYNAKTDKLNTFQIIIIANDEDTFIQFVYPKDGINWLQGETGPLGLPDIRAQSGFVAEDGRFFNLKGSGTEKARFFCENSNVDVSGVWLFRVGPLNYFENVQSPTNKDLLNKAQNDPKSCVEGSGYQHCDLHSTCIDNSDGFCCVCNDGYYGNGYSCIKSDNPIRVMGSLAGELNGITLDERIKLQSYVVTADAHTYTAINPVSSDLATTLKLALPVFTAIGWIFAEPLNGALNGYQLTGGRLFHSSKIRFDTNQSLSINQTFEGLNFWDQLLVKIEFLGEIPQLTHDAKIRISDFLEEYKYISPLHLRSMQSHTIEILGENRSLKFQIEQDIQFERCLLENKTMYNNKPALHKVSKIVQDYFEQNKALRSSILTKIGFDSNACSDGSAVCAENTVCVPLHKDTYKCECMHGYTIQPNPNGMNICVDINECDFDTHLCDVNSFCVNNDGGYSCVCLEGYVGNGYSCSSNESVENFTSTTYSPDYIEKNVDSSTYFSTYNSSTEDELAECYHCSPDADCIEKRCRCRNGFSGDGYSCQQICNYFEIWENGKCSSSLSEAQDVAPNCNFLGDCTCPEQYELVEDVEMCRYSGNNESDFKFEEFVPCDIDSNCHINATCEWNDNEMRHMCTCKPGYHGDGYRCELIYDSCKVKPQICGPHATCSYNELNGKFECKCSYGYDEDGYRCQHAPYCKEDNHCGDNASCDKGVCICLPGFERDISDTCTQVGRCGSVFCGINALCKWDIIEAVQYCVCMEGYEGDPLVGCKSTPISCNVKNNCGAHATCQLTKHASTYNCQCDSGFHGDGYICTEDQNCLNSPQMCDMNAKCLSTVSGLVCSCEEGFYGNGSVCYERQQHESDFLLVSQGIVIIRVPLNGKNVKPIAVASMAIDLDKDCIEGRFYWSDISAKKIISAKYDGTDAKPFITEDIESPEGIAIDSVSRRIYWADSIKDSIEVASLENPTLRSVIINKNLVNPRGIAVDPFKEKLYWSDWNRDSPKIEMSNLDGTAREVLLSKDKVILPNSLVILENSRELCYADAGSKIIECINSETKETRTVSNELTYPFGLAFSHDQFFWSDWLTKKLESVDKVGNRQKSIQTPFFGSHKMYGMTAIDNVCPQWESPCNFINGGCLDSRICLPNRQAPSGKSCKCTSLSKMCNV